MVRLLFLAVALLAFGCSSDHSAFLASNPEEINSSIQEKQRSKNKYLAYTHRIQVTVGKAELSSVFKSFVDACTSDTKHNCLIMHSEQSGGRYAYGNIRIRVTPEGIPKYKSLVSELGEIEQQSTSAKDLTDSVMDTEKRLEMLETYQEKLKELEQRPDINIESLIKVSSEISDVQIQIEYAQGQKAKLYKKINMDVMTISLQTKENESFVSPIGEALSNFGEDLSEGVAIFITTVAYLLPWVLLIAFFIWFVRFLWARRKRWKNS